MAVRLKEFFSNMYQRFGKEEGSARSITFLVDLKERPYEFLSFLSVVLVLFAGKGSTRPNSWNILKVFWNFQ